MPQATGSAFSVPPHFFINHEPDFYWKDHRGRASQSRAVSSLAFKKAQLQSHQRLQDLQPHQHRHRAPAQDFKHPQARLLRALHLTHRLLTHGAPAPPRSHTYPTSCFPPPVTRRKAPEKRTGKCKKPTRPLL